MSNHNRPLLQLAIDTCDLSSALQLADVAYPDYDIAEIGTPLIVEEGLRALEALKSRHPDKQYLADLKIIDAGRLEAERAFEHGANVVTVLALADNETIQGALDTARDYGAQVMADLIGTPDPVGRARELESMGVQIICIHVARDAQHLRTHRMEEVQVMRKSLQARLAVAGGLKLENVNRVVASGADILVFGGAIASHPAPSKAAAEIINQIQEAHTCSHNAS